MGSMSIFHWIILFFVVAMLFGTKRLRDVGVDLGRAIKGFKEGVRDESDSHIAQSEKEIAEKAKSDIYRS